MRKFSKSTLSGLLLAPIALQAAVLNPVTYSMRNGEQTGVSYHDDTYSGSGSVTTDLAYLSGGLGQLTDNIITGPHFDANIGNGPAYEWVGWWSISPDIVFDFGTPVHVDTVRVYADNAPYAGVQMFGSAQLSGSLNGTDYTLLSDLLTAPAELSDFSSARYLDLAAGADLRYLRLVLNDQIAFSHWIFVGEVDFTGSTVESSVPEASTWAAVGLTALLGLRRWRLGTRGAG